MNNLIEEYSEQSTHFVYDENNLCVGYHFDKAKFAELIVQEIANKLEEHGIVEVAMEIKAQFGVK